MPVLNRGQDKQFKQERDNLVSMQTKLLEERKNLFHDLVFPQQVEKIEPKVETDYVLPSEKVKCKAYL